jgi:anti-anti-sigma regulatory factor
MGLPPLDQLTTGLADHVCHVVGHRGDLARTAPAYLAAGLTLGQRAVVAAPPAELGTAHAVAAAAHAAGSVAVAVVELSSARRPGPLDPATTIEAARAGLEQALDGGHSGLRVVALLSTVAADPDLGPSFAAWEHALDQWRSTRPIAWSCWLDRAVLGDRTVNQLACLHPRVVTTGAPVPFRLFHRAGRLVLEGELDTFSTPLLARALEVVRPEPGRRLVVDARGLTFVNHRAVLAIVDGLARRHPAGVTLAGAPSVSPRLLESLGVQPHLLDALPSPW